MLISAPEIILFNSISSLINYIRTDFNNNTDETKTLLYKILVGNQVERYNLFQESKSVLITREDNPRHLSIKLFFNANVTGAPTIHITLPSESTINNTLGIGQGMREDDFDDEEVSFRVQYNRRFKATYNVVITSDNTNEIILLYHLIRSCLISLVDHLNISGLQNIEFSGADLSQNINITPDIFARSIGISLQYNAGGLELVGTPMLSDVIFQGTAINTNS